jgi:hypothetical protein
MNRRNVEPTSILDYGSPAASRLVESIRPGEDSQIGFLRAAHGAISRQLHPVSQSKSVNLFQRQSTRGVDHAANASRVWKDSREAAESAHAYGRCGSRGGSGTSASRSLACSFPAACCWRGLNSKSTATGVVSRRSTDPLSQGRRRLSRSTTMERPCSKPFALQPSISRVELGHARLSVTCRTSSRSAAGSSMRETICSISSAHSKIRGRARPSSCSTEVGAALDARLAGDRAASLVVDADD